MAERIFRDFIFEPPDYFADFVAGCFSSFLRAKVPRKIHQANPRQHPFYFIQQNPPTHVCRGAASANILAKRLADSLTLPHKESDKKSLAKKLPKNERKRAQTPERKRAQKPWSSFPCFFGIPCFFSFARNSFFLSVFPLFFRDFRGSLRKKNPCLFDGFPCLFPKKRGKED